MNTSEVLNKAADLIEECGWTTQRQANSEGHSNPWGEREGSSLCIEGGIKAAAGLAYNFEVRACPAGIAVMNYLADRTSVSKLWFWNDHVARDASEVIEVLRAAAVIEAAKENTETPAQVPA